LGGKEECKIFEGKWRDNSKKEFKNELKLLFMLCLIIYINRIKNK